MVVVTWKHLAASGKNTVIQMIMMVVRESLLVVEEQTAQPRSSSVTMEIADIQTANYHAYQQVGNAMETWIVWTVVMRRNVL